MWSPERKVPRFKCLSCEHSFSCSNNLYKHYRTFTDHRPQPKPSLNCKEATDLFLDKDLSPCQRKARLRELFKGRLTSEELVELALPRIAKIIQTSQFVYEKCKKKSGEIRKAAVKNEFIELCEHIFRTFPSLPKEIALSSSPCLTSLVSSVRDSTCDQLLPSSPGRRFLQFLDDRNAKKSLLEQLIIDNNSLACETILSCCGGKVFKSTLMPMFVKSYHEAFLEFDLGLVSSFNIGQNQVSSILRGHWGKKLEEKTGLNPILPR